MKTLLLLSLLLTAHASACINVEGTALDGSAGTDGGYSPARILQAILNKTPEQRAEEFLHARNHHSQDTFSEKEHEGVQEVLKGNPARAITLFKQIETEHPGRYSTAANLGTAYELNGELENALTWIREGIARNDKSHYGTEWLHVEILKTRIKLREDPDYLRQNHVVSLPDSYSRSSIIRIADDTRSIDEIGLAIFYQLKERILFVKPPDPVVADLLFTLAHIKARTTTLESALGLLSMSADYGSANPAQLTVTIAQFERTILHRQIKKWSLISLGILAGIFLLYLAWRKKCFFLTRSAYDKHRTAASPQL